MSEAKHTPTPWTLYLSTDARPHAISAAVGTICKVPHYGFASDARGEEQTANAALIVRAVNRDHLFEEMVKALEEIASEDYEPVDTMLGESWSRAAANIARSVLAKLTAGERE